MMKGRGGAQGEHTGGHTEGGDLQGGGRHLCSPSSSMLQRWKLQVGSGCMQGPMAHRLACREGGGGGQVGSGCMHAGTRIYHVCRQK